MAINNTMKSTEFLIESTKAVCMKKFEKVLFGEKTQGQTEKDTKVEDKFWRLLLDFIDENESSPATAKMFKELQSCQQYFKEVLKPTVSTVYRGSSMAPSEVIKLLTNGSKKTNKYLIANGTHLYNPRGEIQSWTNDIKIAAGFHGEGGSYGKRSGHVKVIYKTTVDKNFLMNTEFINHLAFNHTSIDDMENEVIRIGKSSVKVEIYINTANLKSVLWDKPELFKSLI